MIQRIFTGLAFFLAFVLLILYIGNWSYALSAPYSLGFEGPIIWVANMLSQGGNIYSISTLSNEPWIVTIYPPLYLTLMALVVKIFGVSYAFMRAYNMIATSLLALTMICLFRSFKCSSGLIAACLVYFFSFMAVATQSYEARPDMTVILFSVFMMERFVHLYQAQKRDFVSYLPVVFLAIVAILAKQQAIVFILSIFVFLLFERSYKLAFQFFLGWLVTACMIIGILQIITGGFIQHMTFLSSVKSNFHIVTTNLNDFGVDWLKIGFALIAIPLGLLIIKKLKGIEQLPVILFAVSSCLFFYSMGIPGASLNHVISALFALTWILAILLKQIPLPFSFIALAVSACAFVAHLVLSVNGPKLLPYALNDITYLKGLNLKDKLVLTDDPYLNIITESKPDIEDCVTFLNVWKSKNVSPLPLTDLVEKKLYSAIMINSTDCQNGGEAVWWPKPFITSLSNNYQKDKKINCSGWTIDVWLPKKSQ